MIIETELGDINLHKTMTQKPELLILAGLPASGKTARALAWVAEDPDARMRISWDDLRMGMFGSDWIFNRSQEEEMKTHSRKIAERALTAGLSVVIDNTNLSSRVRNQWNQLGLTYSATIVEEEIDTSLSDCLYRDHKRTGRARVGRAVIENMALRYGFIDWNDKENYYKSNSGKDFVIFDVDGTLANCEWRREYVRGETQHLTDCSPLVAFKDGVCTTCGTKKFKKDWRRFFAEVDKDILIEPVANLFHMLQKRYDIIVVSGRPIDPCGKPTEDWLAKHDLTPKHLFMRGGADSREDTVVKKEIAELLPLDRVAYVIDDRPSVLRMWQSLGLTTLAVGDLKEF